MKMTKINDLLNNINMEGLENKLEIANETLKEGFHDKRLIYALGIDAVGMLSALGYLGFCPVGDVLDIAYAPLQTKLLHDQYKNDLTGSEEKILGTISFLEEILPGPSDLIPTGMIYHFTAAYERVKSRYETKLTGDIK